MSLISLKTNLKSLKFGKDRPGGGDSGLPYIQTPIPTNLPSNYLDFPVRGGLNAVIKSAEDTKRIAKFLTDSPRGPVFILKQVGLQLSNPKLDKPSDLSSPLNLGQLNVLGRSIESTRIYNAGINTLAQVPVGAFGIHFDRHGLTPILDEKSKYEYIVGYKNLASGGKENRLVQLHSQLFFASKDKIVSPSTLSLGNQILGGVKQFFSKTSNENSDTIYDYAGGPGSLYGIGRTKVKRYSYTDKTTEIRQSVQSPSRALNSISFDYDLISQPKYSDNSTAGISFVDFRKTINEKFNRPKDSKLPIGSDYNRDNMESRVGIGNPGNKNRDRSKITATYGKEITWDKINMVPITDLDFEKIEKEIPGTMTRDLIKFRFEAIDNNKISSLSTTKIIFRAFLTGINDNFSGEWDSFKYTGRGEHFYTYQGFDRQFSFNFKIAAQSRDEMKPLYQKLNFLVSNTAPDYNKNGFMRGSFMMLTIGNWLYRQPGILKSIALTVDDNTPWEIAMNKPEEEEESMNELPHIINAAVNFIPLHSFIPRKGYESPVKFIHTGHSFPDSKWLEKGKVLTNAQ